jgi:hypothetical protein
MGAIRYAYGVFAQSQKERDHWEDLGIGGRTTMGSWRNTMG